MPHTNILVNILQIFDTAIIAFLIDPGSLTNTFQLRVIKEMEITGQVIPKVRLLSRFNNSSEMTGGEVILTINTEGVVKDIPFQVISGDIAFHAILGRPWIHEMDMIPLTLH